MTNLIIHNLSRPTDPIHAKLAKSFFSKLAGLMFRKELPIDSGLLLTETKDSILNTSIHMLFMNFDICAVWIDSSHHVADVKLAKKWHLAYFSKKPAQFVLELHSSRITSFVVGDQLQYEYEK